MEVLVSMGVFEEKVVSSLLFDLKPSRSGLCESARMEI